MNMMINWGYANLKSNEHDGKSESSSIEREVCRVLEVCRSVRFDRNGQLGFLKSKLGKV